VRITDAPPTTEAEWLTTVGDALDYLGWSWIHHRPARRAHGRWHTPTQGNSGKGFPDIVAVRPPRILFLELKRDQGGRVSPEQSEGISNLRACGLEAHVVSLPSSWEFLSGLIAHGPEQLSLTSNSTGASWLPLTKDMET